MAAKNAAIDSFFVSNCYSVLRLIQPLMKRAQSVKEGDVWDFFVGQPDGAWQWGRGQGRAVGVGPARLSLYSGVDCGHKRWHLCRQCLIPPVKNLSNIEQSHSSGGCHE